MHVTKVVDIFTRNSEQLSLHFFLFFYKFILIFQVCYFWKAKRKKNEILHLGPWNFCNRSNQVPRRTGSRGGAAGRIPAVLCTGDDGGEGYEHQEVRSYLGVRSDGVGMAEGGPPKASRAGGGGKLRRRCSGGLGAAG